MTIQRPLEQAVADILEQSRLGQGFSQAEVAARAQAAGYDVKQEKVSRVLRGKNAMNLTDAEGIATALGLRLSTVLALAEGGGVDSVRSIDVATEAGSGSSASGGRRRKPRPVSVVPPEA